MTNICRSPPQDALVHSMFTGEGEAGRYVVAAQSIQPGQLVLAAAPYALVFNPNEFASGLFLMATASTDASAGAAQGAGGATPIAKKKKKKKSTPSSSSGASFTTATQESSADAEAPTHFTTTASWCAGCFRRILAGTPLVNYTELRLAALDISLEQEQMEEHLRAVSTAAQHSKGEGNSSHEEKEEDEAVSRSKKPSKSTTMRKNDAVKLKQKMREKSVRQRTNILSDHLQYRQRIPTGDASALPFAWVSSAAERCGNAPEPLCATSCAGVAGCTGCGVVSYCSPRCWRETQDQHVRTGECSVLRRVYPQVMAEYYYAGDRSAKKKEVAAVMPGEEPSRWARGTSEEKAVEAECMLLVAIVLARCAKEGHMASWTSVEETAKVNLTSQQLKKSELTSEASDARASQFSQVAVDSIVVPNEVLTIQETRAALGLTGTVETMDAAIDDNDKANQDEHKYISVRSSLEAEGINDEDAGVADHALMNVRLPRYRDCAQLITNLSVLPKERKGVYSSYYRKFVKTFLPWVPTSTTTAVSALAAESVHSLSESFFVRICAAAQCNSFGIWSPNAGCIAFGLYPEASFFNHSCVPNVCRVMHHGGRCAGFYALRSIAPGEQMTISYVEVHQSHTAERRRALLASFRFFCECERCTGSASPKGSPVIEMAPVSSFAAEAPSDDTIHFCSQCTARGYMRPVRGCSFTSSGTLRKCTVCGWEQTVVG